MHCWLPRRDLIARFLKDHTIQLSLQRYLRHINSLENRYTTENSIGFLIPNILYKINGDICYYVF